MRDGYGEKKVVSCISHSTTNSFPLINVIMSRRLPTKTTLEWITTICSTLSVIGVAILLHLHNINNNNPSTSMTGTIISSQDQYKPDAHTSGVSSFRSVLPSEDNINNLNTHASTKNTQYSRLNPTNLNAPISQKSFANFLKKSGSERSVSSIDIVTPPDKNGVTGMLNGATILVTGAGSGIGMATAHAVLRECGNVVLLGRNATKISNVYNNLTLNYLPVVSKKCAPTTPRILKVTADIRNITEIRAAMLTISQKFPTLDGAANIAGISGPIDYIDSSSMDSWLLSDNDPILNNLYGTIQSIRAEIELFKQLGQRYASIVNAGSQNSFVGCAQGALYVASKYGIKGVTKSVALSYAYPSESNGNLTLRVNAIAPGMVDTPLTRNQAKLMEGLQPFECYVKNGSNYIIKDYGCPNIAETDPLWLEMKQELIESGMIPIERIIAPQEMANVIVFLLSNYTSAVTGSVWLADGGATAM